MSRHTPSITPAYLTPYNALEAYRNKVSYRMGKGLHSVEPVSAKTIAAGEARLDKFMADFWETVTPDEAFAAYELTDDQALDWVTSQPCFAHLTVDRVIRDDRLRVLAARHAMKVMQ